MTEEEKRAKALAFLEAEKQRLQTNPYRRDAIDAETSRRINSNQRFYASFAQQGITIKELQKAYNDAYRRGERDMLNYRFNFFYAATVIAYHEAFSASPEEASAFMKSLATAPKECKTHEELVQLCLTETGVDTSYADEKKEKAHATRKDRAAVDRMQKTGITQRDLEIEAQIGYEDGRNEPFFLSSCYATTGIMLSRLHGADAAAIERFLERIAEVVDEEISVDDIVERAKREAGVDVGQMAKENPQ